MAMVADKREDQSTSLEVVGTNVLERNLAAQTRFVVNQGGTGSSKTISLCQMFIMLALRETGSVFSIVRTAMPSLRSSAMRDFFNLLKKYKLYYEENHNKSEKIYHLHGNEIEFFGLDEPQKVRSRKRKYLWMNEANEFSYEAYTQLNLRTTYRVYMDYNPSDEQHWIYSKIHPREDCTLIKSTYRDATEFLPKEQIDEIERLKETDANYWRIYGLGEIGHRQSVIYTNWELGDWPRSVQEVIYGLDFGFNHPTALVKIGISENTIYIDEKIYQSKLTNMDLISLLDQEIAEPYALIYADAEDPARIDEIARHTRKNGESFNIHPAEKGKDSVSKGIDTVKSYKLVVTKGSVNVQNEMRLYRWKENKAGDLLEEPVKFRDHLMDGIRYALFTHKSQGGEAAVSMDDQKTDEIDYDPFKARRGGRGVFS